ncbi:MAG: T9SS type A sorting domain-containing protein [Cryomorphaceae bacterium]|nr:T9SS type A sorting domain-containing protein [Cryomorphaceae bacterium]
MKAKIKLLFCLLFGIYQIQAQVVHQVTLQVNQPPKLFAHAGNDSAFLIGSVIDLGEIPAATGGTSPYTYQWNPGSMLAPGRDTMANPDYVVMPVIQTFTLTVTDDRNCQAFDSVTVDFFMSNNSFKDKSLKVYPNPASGSVSVELHKPNGTLELFSIDGRMLKSVEVTQSVISLDITALSRGSYLLHYTSEGNKQTLRIQVQ